MNIYLTTTGNSLISALLKIFESTFTVMLCPTTYASPSQYPLSSKSNHQYIQEQAIAIRWYRV